MSTFAVGDLVQYVGGGRFRGAQVFDGHSRLNVGEVGTVHAIPGHRGELGCTFGALKVSLNKSDVRAAPGALSSLPQIRQAMMKSESLPTFEGQPILSDLGPAPSASFRGAGNSRRAQFPLLPTRCSRGSSGRARLAVTVARLCGPVGMGGLRGEAAAPEEAAAAALEASMEPDRPHPPSFYCPISHQCMHDPVVLADGHTYERRYIEKWLKLHDTSPVSGVLLTNKTVFPNHALRNAIEEYFEQVLLEHRQSIRKTTAGLFRQRGKFSINARLLKTIDSLMQCSILVNADFSIEMVLKKIMEEAKHLVGAEAASVFLMDRERQELYSTVNSTDTEIRMPCKSGVAGHVACTGQPLIVENAYGDSHFNTEIDRRTGFRTRNILCVPIRAWTGIIGVAQLINKCSGGVLTVPDSQVHSFTSDDQHFFEVLAAQAGSAIVNSGIFQRIPSKPKLSVTTDNDDACTSALVDSPTQKRTNPLDGRLQVSAPTSPLTCLMPFLKQAWERWETDTFTLAELADNKPLSVLATYLLEQYDLISYFSLNRVKLERFLTEIEDGYPDANLYHNRCHAASVLHVMHALLFHGGLAEACSQAAEALPQCDRQSFLILVCILAAAVHDFEHPGVSNDFHVMTGSDRAITYNDRSVNEQHHLAAAFRVLLRPECNFLEAMEKHKFQALRSMMLDLVLATDMAEHNRILDAFKSMTQRSGAAADGAQFVPACAKEAMLVLKVALKCADLGHLTLSWGSHMRWVRRLEEEFFRQGDLEKERRAPKISFLMDRCKPGVSQTQLGFFDFVVLPLFRPLLAAFPAVAPMVCAVEANYENWRKTQASLDCST